MANETTLTKKIQNYLKTEYSYVFKFHGNEYTEQGVPDLIGYYKMFFIAIEVKYGKNKISPIQEKQIELINQRKSFAIWVNEEDWKEKIDSLKLKIDKIWEKINQK